PSADNIVGEDPAGPPPLVVAPEQGHRGEALQGERQVRAHHGREPVRLPLEGEEGALDLLVVLELELEEPHEVDGQARRAGDSDGGVRVGREHLLDLAVGDRRAHRRPPVTGHDDAAGVGERHDRRRVRRRRGLGEGGGAAREEVGRGGAAEADAGGAARGEEAGRQPVRGQRTHWPPFGTNPRTKESALVSSTSSISDSRESTSTSRAWAATGGGGTSASSSRGGRGFSNFWATVPPSPDSILDALEAHDSGEGADCGDCTADPARRAATRSAALRLESN